MSLHLNERVRRRLNELSPRAFEFFAGDLLVFLGLSAVVVTRQSGDGGIDAHCRIATGGIIDMPVGVQVKRLRHSVQRPEMDRFVGALANRYSCGIFITTARFTRSALEKAASIPHISTVDGDQVVNILVTNGIGIASDAIDEGYFTPFEEYLEDETHPDRAGQDLAREITPENDLISLRALSYALRVDTKTVRNWVQKGRLVPDSGKDKAGNDGLFFRRSRIDDIRRQFNLSSIPTSEEDWLENFIRYASYGSLNKSYKPVMLMAMLDATSDTGTISEESLVELFWSFYRARQVNGLCPEDNSSILSRPEAASYSDVRQLIIQYPLNRFIIQGFMEYQREERIVRFRPEIWSGLRYRHVLELRRSLQRQIDQYFRRIGAQS